MSLRGMLKTSVTGLAGSLSRALSGPCRLAAEMGVPWRVPILAYHQVAECGGPTGYAWRVTPAAFEAQMRWLAEGGYQVLSLGAFLRDRDEGRLRPRSVVLTFDDGFRGVLLHAYPVLKRYGFPATLFLATGSMGQAEFPWVRHWLLGDEDPQEYRPLSWDEIRGLDSTVVELGSHTVSHPHLGRLPPKKMEEELTESRRQIETETGQAVRFLAYPGGIARYADHSTETRRLLMATGYSAALVSEVGRNGPSADRFTLRRLGVGVDDSLGVFGAKVVGAYSWVRAVQSIGHTMLADAASY